MDLEEEAEARTAGLVYSNLPLRGAVDLTRENVLAFDALVRDAKRPVLVHCASGNRVGAMAALRAAWVDGKEIDEAIATGKAWGLRSEEHTSELQSLMRTSYAVFCLKKKNKN